MEGSLCLVAAQKMSFKPICITQRKAFYYICYHHPFVPSSAVIIVQLPCSGIVSAFPLSGTGGWDPIPIAAKGWFHRPTVESQCVCVITERAQLEACRKNEQEGKRHESMPEYVFGNYSAQFSRLWESTMPTVDRRSNRIGLSSSRNGDFGRTFFCTGFLDIGFQRSA